MKLTKAKQRQLDTAYFTLVQVCLYDRPLGEMEPLLADDIMNFGAGKKEITKSKSAFLKQIKNQKNLASGLKMDFKIKPVLRKVINKGYGAIYTDDIINTVWINGTKNKLKFRLSFIFEYRHHKWLLVHSHTSTPDQQRFDNEIWPVEELKKRTAVLEKSLDEKIAELQVKNRELEIEASMERVRSRTTAMQKSDELAETVSVVFQQLLGLGIRPEQMRTCAIVTLQPNKPVGECWITKPGGDIMPESFMVPYDESSAYKTIYDAWKRGEKFVTVHLSGDALIQHLIFLKKYAKIPTGEFQPLPDQPAETYTHAMFFTQGYLFIITNEPLPGYHDIFKRFGTVFQQTYTRFLDLKKAEAQAKEARIEVSLEKVRSKAMAMQKSDDLAIVVSTMFEELEKLEHKIIRCGVAIHNKQKNTADLWATTVTDKGRVAQVTGDESMDIHPMLEGAYESWLKQVDYGYVLEGADLVNFYKALTATNFKLPGSQSVDMPTDGLRQYLHVSHFPAGGLYAFSETAFPEESKNVMRRFAEVFNLTYTRFSDLQKAETQAHEAVRRASLDRVRAETASMRTTADLETITPLIWNELTTLGVPFTRCGVFIMDEKHSQIHTFLSTPDGKAIAAFHLPYDAPGTSAQVVSHWRKKEMYMEHWDRATFINWTDTLLKQGAIRSPEKYLTDHPPANLDLHFLPFLQGMLYVGSETSLNNEEVHLVQELAGAFSTAYARYEDFNKLELAKEQIEKTLADLKQAQAQLVQSEKMASLGELTAGIAHEIQNPLNFVNNFSELNTELIEELQAAINEGNAEDVIALAKDIEENEKKINHHGKRADSIVKGMLQHSRSSSGIKEPVDINQLADEYLRLAYHGLRAKDNSFNATMKTSFDDHIGKINIISQDIGRVLLNLITNAFYAVDEKKKSGVEHYEPIVSITTKKLDSNVEIKVADNGEGIPEKLLDKIFQPFFTTKPTGQGTGLGLSLSYDIVKAHGGEIKVETNEGKGSAFIIQLPIIC
jgi:signal transduction histidine kinase